MAYKVFIICVFKDSDLACDFRRRLEEVGIEASWAVDLKDIDLGVPTRAVRDQRSLRDSDEVIVLLTSNSLHSQGVLFEVGAAFGMHKRITLILVGVDNDELPPLFRGLHSVRYAVVNDYIAELKKRAEDKELIRH